MSEIFAVKHGTAASKGGFCDQRVEPTQLFGGGKQIGIENQVLITGTGHETMNTLPHDLVRVPD